MNDPFDRSDIGESSLAATERLRARLMTQGPAGSQQTSRRGGFAWAIAAALFAFAAGLIANPWFEQTVRGRLPFVAAASNGEADALEKRLAALERARPSAPAVASERLARTEAKVESSTDQIQRDAERIDELNRLLAQLSARVAAEEARDASVVATAQGAADRAESMLTVLLLRRAVEDGRPLGALLPATRRLFGEQYADEVAALEALSAAPVTRAQLARQLAGLSDAGPGATRPDWWQAFIRRVETTFSAGEGAGPVVQAQGLMARGNLAAAAAALRRSAALRGNATVRGWLAGADRLLAGEAALVTLEAAAATPLPAPATVTAPTR
ncbi:hypothetical protein [Sandarakinorhabdus limnophila]|uniref:hypothetical protein n=1 Tax=Sandarakinorhabdus limnophila TaxID=210512 RepID=UPI002355E739